MPTHTFIYTFGEVSCRIWTNVCFVLYTCTHTCTHRTKNILVKQCLTVKMWFKLCSFLFHTYMFHPHLDGQNFQVLSYAGKFPDYSYRIPLNKYCYMAMTKTPQTCDNLKRAVVWHSDGLRWRRWESPPHPQNWISSGLTETIWQQTAAFRSLSSPLTAVCSLHPNPWKRPVIHWKACSIIYTCYLGYLKVNVWTHY